MLRCENKMEKENDEKPQTSNLNIYIFGMLYSLQMKEGKWKKNSQTERK